jgi:NADPH:quinone reductase-like Zn-dependent oxidoreductase
LSKKTKQGAFLEYTFTDISSGFFENARTKLAKWSQRITYKKLDISQDPLAQGFDAEEFDVVIAANVLHATQNMKTTMNNLRLLLKPRGKLVVLEGNHHPALALPFVLLPGWWYAEDDYRDLEEGPMMPTKVWNRLLLDTGFSGIDTCIQGGLGAGDETMSIMYSNKVAHQEETGSITVCGPLIDDKEVVFAQMIADAISSLGHSVDVKPFAELDPSSNSYYIVVDSPDDSLLQNVSEERFAALQSLLVHNAGILWVIPDSDIPESKFIKGMLRTLRIESSNKSLLSFDQVPYTDRGVSGILKLVRALLDPEMTRAQDQDFLWHNESIHLPRMRMLKDAKESFAVEQGVSFRKEQNMWAGDRALEMTIEVAGSPDSIYFRRTDDLQSPLAEDEIVVQVEAVGVSHRDLDLVQGAVSWAPPGFDGAGKVVKVGSGVADLQQGDSVFFLALEGSALATYRKMPAWHAARIPSYTSITEAASMPLAYSLAVLALIRTARLQKNETVLIHSAAGAVGQACVVIAQHLGARVLATAGTSEKRDFLHKTFGIPSDQIFSSRTPSFRDGILCATGGKGVDVIVNSLGGELLADTWALAARFGRFVEIDKKAAFQNNHLPMRTFDKNVSFSTIDLRGLHQHKPEEVREVFGEVVRLLRRRVVVPIKPVTVLPISQFSTTLRKLRSGDNMGKNVVTLGHDQQVVAESSLRPTQFSLKTDATYLITGGTRGIGLSLAYWMIENGARNVVVLGRSGASGPEVKKLLDKYNGTDVTVRALACDIGSREQLAKVVESIQDLPPVRGVVHSALLLSVRCPNPHSAYSCKLETDARLTGQIV